MPTPRTAKVQAEIDKAKVKLAKQQAKVKELETKRTELENMEIVDTVRGLSIPLEDLAALLQSIKGGAATTYGGAATSGQAGPKSIPAKNEQEEPTE